MILIAFTMGLFGSLHCLGMCGPIAMSIPVANPTPVKRLASITVYNLGRILVYSLMGLFAGAIGQTVAMAGYQQGLSIALGVFILLLVFTPLSNKLSSFTLVGRFKNLFGELVRKKSLPSIFALGVFNGMLPCGMVYMSLAGAAATGDMANGVLFMAAFGAGTFPMMASISYMASFFTQRFRNTVRKAFPYMMGVMALLLVVRGLNLGIPYISPKASVEKGLHACCHSNDKKCE